ncbi:MAG: methyltransferase domain-containing protein [Phycisphaerales bacterium]|nr:methyltransferase domain-containing protein [Phycisphaerales bacterium]
MSGPLELRRYLDPRERDAAAACPIRDAVNIPLGELARRTHELPPPSDTISIATDQALYVRTSNALMALGRTCSHISEFDHETAPSTTRGRLWRPSAFVERAARTLSPGRAIDVGCGTGRDAVFLAAGGWRVVAIDHLPDAIHRGLGLAHHSGIAPGAIQWNCADARSTIRKQIAEFDLVVFVRFFDRAVVEQATQITRPGGSIVIEAFEDSSATGPRCPATSEAELRRLFNGLEFRQVEAGTDERGRRLLRVWAIR